MGSPRMRVRSLAREAAFQFLYQGDSGGSSAAEDLDKFLEGSRLPPEGREFARALALGARERREETDRLIGEVSENWSVPRMAVVDRNILRLGAYEMIWHATTPPKVALNEAIELAKRFGSAKSGAFVNGILDRLLPRALAVRGTPAPPPPSASHV
ncbi:MAG: transcription antitermination factor NusB [Planctomycetales bacterium]|nr:transcription antitermination factor NusB [Planctomycetales bacterium]